METIRVDSKHYSNVVYKYYRLQHDHYSISLFCVLNLQIYNIIYYIFIYFDLFVNMQYILVYYGVLYFPFDLFTLSAMQYELL